MNKKGNFIEIFPEAHNNLVTKVLELENKVEALTKQVSDLTIAVGRLEGRTGNVIRVSDTKVDVVSWKDFRDFLDDNAEDFESINNRLDALEQTILIKMMERWESLVRKAEMLDKRLDSLERWQAKEEQGDAIGDNI